MVGRWCFSLHSFRGWTSVNIRHFDHIYTGTFTGPIYPPNSTIIYYPIPKASMYQIFTYIYHRNQPNVCKYAIHGYVDGTWYMGISFYLVYIHKTELKSRFLLNLALSRPFFLCRMWGPKNCFPVAPALRTSDKFHEVTMEPEPSWYPWDRGNEGRSRKTTLRCWPWEEE